MAKIITKHLLRKIRGRGSLFCEENLIVHRYSMVICICFSNIFKHRGKKHLWRCIPMWSKHCPTGKEVDGRQYFNCWICVDEERIDSPPNLYADVLISNVTVFGNRVCEGVIQVNEIVRMGPNRDGDLIRRGRDSRTHWLPDQDMMRRSLSANQEESP